MPQQMLATTDAGHNRCWPQQMLIHFPCLFLHKHSQIVLTYSGEAVVFVIVALELELGLFNETPIQEMT